MKLPTNLVDRIIAHFLAREPDYRIGDDDAPYMDRWMLFPMNRFGNVYVHRMHRSDDDRALHDHPWPFVSYVLRSGYFEMVRDPDVSCLMHIKDRIEGSFAFMRPSHAHRAILRSNLMAVADSSQGVLFEIADARKEVESWSVCLIGPHVREWGFHCPKGWVHWKQFTTPTVGGNKRWRGCD